MKTTIVTEAIISRQSVLDKLIHTLLPARSNKGKERELTISPELIGLYEKAHEGTQRILDELPMRMKRFADEHNFAAVVDTYHQLYDKYIQRGELRKLEVLTAAFDIGGAVDLLALNIDIDTLVAYTLQRMRSCNVLREGKGEIVFECSINSEVGKPELFSTPGVQFNELRNYYTYCVPEDDEPYWYCTSTGVLHCRDCGYYFPTEVRRLTRAQMWREVTNLMQQGHTLHDEDCEPLTRQQLIHNICGSKL